jgi:hypothetical protein
VTIENVRQSFIIRSPRKSTSLELNIPKSKVWKVVQERLRRKPCRLQLVRYLSDSDKNQRHEICGQVTDKMEKADYLNTILFSDENTFYLSGKINRHNIRI